MLHVIVVDVGGTTIKAGIVNRDGDVRGYHQKPTLEGETVPEPIVSRIKTSIQELLDSFQDIKIEAIGIGIPGAISSPEGLLIDLLNIPVLSGNYFRTIRRPSWPKGCRSTGVFEYSVKQLKMLCFFTQGGVGNSNEDKSDSQCVCWFYD